MPGTEPDLHANGVTMSRAVAAVTAPTVAPDSPRFAMRLALLDAEEPDRTPFCGGGRRSAKTAGRTMLGRL
jgi:hypothetical protein